MTSPKRTDNPFNATLAAHGFELTNYMSHIYSYTRADGSEARFCRAQATSGPWGGTLRKSHDELAIVLATLLDQTVTGGHGVTLAQLLEAATALAEAEARAANVRGVNIGAVVANVRRAVEKRAVGAWATGEGT